MARAWSDAGPASAPLGPIPEGSCPNQSSRTCPADGSRVTGSAAGRSRRDRCRVRADDRHRVGCLGDDRAPRIDDHRATERGVPGRPTDLGGRDDPGAVLDGAGTQQDLPVVAAGPLGEVGRHGQDLGARRGRASGTAPGTAGRSRSTARPRPHPRRRRPPDRPRLTRADSVSTGPASTATSNRWILRYVAAIDPSGRISTLVL